MTWILWIGLAIVWLGFAVVQRANPMTFHACVTRSIICSGIATILKGMP